MADLTTDLARQDQVFLARLIERLPLGSISKTAKQLFIEDPKAANWLAEQVPLYQKSMLKLSLLEFFKSRAGLVLLGLSYSDFLDKVLPYADDNQTSDISRCSYVDVSERGRTASGIITDFLSCSEEEPEKYATTLKQTQTFLTNQWLGEDDPLLVDGRENVFFVVIKNGKLCVVYAKRVNNMWSVDGWRLHEKGYGFDSCRVFRNKL